MPAPSIDPTHDPIVIPTFRPETPLPPVELAASPLPTILAIITLLNDIGIPSTIASCATRKAGISAAIDRLGPSEAYSFETAWTSRGPLIQAPRRIPPPPSASK